MEVDWGGAGRAAERARGAGALLGALLGDALEQGSVGVGRRGYSICAGDEPWCGCPERGTGGESESAPVSGSVPLGASVSAPTAPRCSESHESTPGWFTGTCEVKAGAAVSQIMQGPTGATQVLRRECAVPT